MRSEINTVYNKCKDVFVKPRKRYYFGKLTFGAPYFYPINFNKNIISFRKLKLKSKEAQNEYAKQYPHLKNSNVSKFTNLPMVRRCKDKIFKLFENYYWISIGRPFAIRWYELGWKDKFGSPRHEWSPSFQIYFFGLQFCMWWEAPNSDYSDKYYEMMVWYLHYCKKDLSKAEQEWPWIEVETKRTTWNKKFIKKMNE